jgi:hypothetical protein
MRNITVTLEEGVARWARIRAAERDQSLSRFLGELLKERMQEEETYEAAMMRYMARPAATLKEPGTPYPDREELHDRASLC